ncbi:hypothetical protein GGR58DRAFT_272772 [Xylaria digitata]|nr:hypothetical protein GGR58DRAFT_272772 [Xylaria digitata]
MAGTPPSIEMAATPVDRAPPPRVSAGDYYRYSRMRELELRNAIGTAKTWNFEKVLGHGSYGITVLLSDRDPLHLHPPRRVVLKRPLIPQAAYHDFIREAQVLRDMRGHAHIGQLIGYADDVSRFRPKRGRFARALRRLRATFNNPPRNLFKALSVGSGPAILLEYLENGSMIKVLAALYRRRAGLPNRVLWSWYHCLVSACVAMTQKKEGFEGGPLELENYVTDGNHYRLVHDDIAARNIMVDERDPLVSEHSIAHKLVMIDFGMARYEPEGAQENAEQINLRDVNLIMLSLINPEALRIMNMDLGEPGLDFGIFNDLGMNTFAAAVIPRHKYPQLDAELRTLLYESWRFGEIGPEGHPSLSDTFRRTKTGMEKSHAAYGYSVRESDDYIRAILHHLLLEPDDDWE